MPKLTREKVRLLKGKAKNSDNDVPNTKEGRKLGLLSGKLSEEEAKKMRKGSRNPAGERLDDLISDETGELTKFGNAIFKDARTTLEKEAEFDLLTGETARKKGQIEFFKRTGVLPGKSKRNK